MFNKLRFLGFSLLFVLLFQGCASVDKYNSQLNSLRNEKSLKSDVDYIHHKLQTLHPDLYHYISKKELDYKFDSLKTELTSPMTSSDFYFKLSPVIASIRQGHTQTFPQTKKFKLKEKTTLNRIGPSPLVQFDFELFDNKLYIVKNYSKDSTLKAGTEVLQLNGTKPVDIISKYRTTFASDGYNNTFINRRLAKGFTGFFYYQNGVTDSINCVLNFKDSIRTIILKRPVLVAAVNPKKSKEESKTDKEEEKKVKGLKKKENKKRHIQGYDPIKHTYSKELSFPVKDSSVAVMKISDFTKGYYKKFYKMSFEQLDSLHTKTLIIDLRDNTGGSSLDIQLLYSYLSDSSFHFIDKSEVTSKTSLWHLNSYKDKPLLAKGILTVLFPFVVVADIVNFLKTEKENDQKYYYALKETKLTKPKPNRFKGKVYVLINGGSFSASSILSSNLKGSKRAVFVGEETGGAYNGCVAGFMPVQMLPNSKLSVKFGLLVCRSHYESQTDGRGIFPDVEISPSLMDRINGIDPELQWILNDVKVFAQP